MILCIVLPLFLSLADGSDEKALLATSRINYSNCLTGYMTDVQSWVSRDGQLTVKKKDEVADLSRRSDVQNAFQELMYSRVRNMIEVKYLSMAKCGLRNVPFVAFHANTMTMRVMQTVEYATFYGNKFRQFQVTKEKYDSMINATGAKEIMLEPLTVMKQSEWSAGLQNMLFPNLRELDLRACEIEILDAFIFKGMPALEKLFLGENLINLIDAHAFIGLTNLKHLDLSRNPCTNPDNGLKASVFFESTGSLQHLKLVSLDLSHTMLGSGLILANLASSVKRLSLCYSRNHRLRSGTFTNKTIRFLDLSGNADSLNEPNVLRGLEKSLEVLYAESTFLKSLEFLKNFENLKVLKASSNEITILPLDVMKSLKSLTVLDLENNRISAWFVDIMSSMPRLQILLLTNNNINVISEEMVSDMAHVRYIAMSRNLMVCYCYVRDMYEIAFRNELMSKQEKFLVTPYSENNVLMYHTGFLDYNERIRNRTNITRPCFEKYGSDNVSKCMSGGFSTNMTGEFLFLDYDGANYDCFSMADSDSIPFGQVVPCGYELRDLKPEQILEETRTNLLLLLIPLVLLPILVFVYAFRRNFRYFLITIRNSAMLSLINEKNIVTESQIYNYDVFVSYCNEDRAWVLDHLLPHVERDCSVSVCLHERDFQVGLSILENIVSCMDRSRSIMLVISKRFLLSQWCQFEMHLAQHRLLETRREDLILVLLEDIPRRLRPNTLHYLMLTKTYIVWPIEDSERREFWKRLKKSLVTQKLKNTQTDSFA